MPVKPAIDLGGGVVPPDVVVNVGGGGVGPVDTTLVATDDPFATSSTRDTFWPQAAVAWLITSVVLVLISVQLVSPTRRWRIFRRRPRREAPA